MVGLADDSSPGGNLSICRFCRGVMSRKKRKSRPQAQRPEPVKTGRKTFLNYLLAFAFGAVIATTVTILAMPNDPAPTPQPVASPGMRYSEPPPGRTIDPSLIDTETMMVRKWRKVDSLDELLKLTGFG
jgi:hypothetical protein